MIPTMSAPEDLVQAFLSTVDSALVPQVAALLDPKTGVTSTPIHKELHGLGELTAPKVFPPSSPCVRNSMSTTQRPPAALAAARGKIVLIFLDRAGA